MPFEKRRETRVIAAVEADVDVGEAGDADEGRLRDALERLNRQSFPVLAEPFAVMGPGRVGGALTDPSRAPRCLSILRELLAPRTVRAGVGVGPAAGARDARGEVGDAFSAAHRALELAFRDDGLTRYVGTGEAGDVLLTAVCRLVDALLLARTAKQWEAVAAYRELGRQGDAAAKLGVTRQSVSDRLAAGHRKAVDDADEAVAAYLSLVRRRRYTA